MKYTAEQEHKWAWCKAFSYPGLRHRKLRVFKRRTRRIADAWRTTHRRMLGSHKLWEMIATQSP